jgi:XRE family transcriptional regulator of biofilm formation
MTITGDTIQRMRIEAGMSVAELARLSGISRGYLHSIENGETQNPSAEVLHNIASRLDTSITELMGVNKKTLTNQVPPSLREFADEQQLTQSDIEMLKGMKYRGKKPKTKNDWWFIFEAIKRTLK